MNGTGSWLDKLTDRQQAEVRFSCLYAKDYNHGTDGHNAKVIIAMMATLLDGAQKEIDDLRAEGDASDTKCEELRVQLSHHHALPDAARWGEPCSICSGVKPGIRGKEKNDDRSGLQIGLEDVWVRP